MDIRKKDHVPSEFTPVERYAEIRRCMWDPTSEQWQIHGQLILEYDEDNGEEYGFIMQDGFGDYEIIEELNGPIPEPERYWLKTWARTRKDQLNRADSW